MTILIWLLLFGPIGALALCAMARNKPWGIPPAVLVGLLMAGRAASAKNGKLSALFLVHLAVFSFFATDEHLRAQPVTGGTGQKALGATGNGSPVGPGSRYGYIENSVTQQEYLSLTSGCSSARPRRSALVN